MPTESRWTWCEKCKHYHWDNHSCAYALAAYAKGGAVSNPLDTAETLRQEWDELNQFVHHTPLSVEGKMRRLIERLLAALEAAEQERSEISRAAQNYLLAEIHVGVSEQTLRDLHARLGSLIGPHLMQRAAAVLTDTEPQR